MTDFLFHIAALSFFFMGLELDELETGAPPDPKIMTELKVVRLAEAAAHDRLAILWDKAVVKKATKSETPSASRTLSPSPDLALIVVQRPSDKKYGTSDGGIIVSVKNKEDLTKLASDYGMNVKHVFDSLVMGTLIPYDFQQAASFVSKLRGDPRVLHAELDVNYYDQQAK